jgi:hypothetical protein
MFDIDQLCSEEPLRGSRFVDIDVRTLGAHDGSGGSKTRRKRHDVGPCAIPDEVRLDTSTEDLVEKTLGFPCHMVIPICNSMTVVDTMQRLENVWMDTRIVVAGEEMLWSWKRDAHRMSLPLPVDVRIENDRVWIDESRR